MSRLKVVYGNNSLNALILRKTLRRVTDRDVVLAGNDLKKLLDKDW
jgi:hypothetical protein